MITKRLYIQNPYTEVIKVTAVGDCNFKLHLNGGIFYSKAEIIEAVNAFEPLSQHEDNVSRITRWLSSITANVTQRQAAKIDTSNLLAALNSYSDGICGELSQYFYNLISLFYPEHYCKIINGSRSGGGGHEWNGFTDGFFDQLRKIPNYKGKYIMASLDEIQADKFLYLEPLRQVVPVHSDQVSYTDYFKSTYPASIIAPYEIINPIDNLKMLLPSGADMVFPLKPTTVVKSESWGDLPNTSCMLCTFPAGVIGNVEMPCNVYKINGTGTVKVKGTTYTLPTDEAALVTLLQQTPNPNLATTTNPWWFNEFEILTNTGGLSCEFMINKKTWILLHNNEIKYETTTGSLGFSRTTASNPVETAIFSVDKGLANGFSFNNLMTFNKNKSFRYPKSNVYWDERLVNYMANADGKKPIRSYQYATVANEVKVFNAGSCVIEQCFAALLHPRQDTFTTSIELSFVIVDESNCYYTLDGTTPDATKTLYTVPFTISATTTVKWINIKADYANSHVNSRTITKTA